MQSLEKRSFTRFNGFQNNIANGQPNDWRCRAGARYLYICEDGLVHYCSQQRGYPGVAARALHRARPAPRVPHREIVRAALHRVVRASGINLRFLARPTESCADRSFSRVGRRTCAD